MKPNEQTYSARRLFTLIMKWNQNHVMDNIWMMMVDSFENQPLTLIIQK